MEVKDLIDFVIPKYNISYKTISKTIDSSKENDYRLNIILDDKYVLRVNNKNVMNEMRLAEIERLILRYNEIGVYAPKYLINSDNKYSIIIEDKICYISEYANYALASDIENEAIEDEKLIHLGLLANKYTNYDLIQTKSMWSIIDLAPLDDKVDEKQENLNALVNELNSIGEKDLAKSVILFNDREREEIKKVFRLLPRCVYQGDLNETNILVNNNHFYGLIDFNLSGTEVNINCFLAETNRSFDEDDLKNMDSISIYNEMINYQEKKLDLILKNYKLNDIEKKVLKNYQNIILLSQYPNVCGYIYGLNNGYKDKIIELIKLIIK